jgi:hypothetical protein
MMCYLNQSLDQIEEYEEDVGLMVIAKEAQGASMDGVPDLIDL